MLNGNNTLDGAGTYIALEIYSGNITIDGNGSLKVDSRSLINANGISVGVNGSLTIMKGTINASTPSADRLLINDPKETAEHATIVDLIRNDLSMVAEQVSVSRYRYIDKLQTNQGSILQTSSEIQGVLPDDYLTNLGSIIFRLLPAGSITGAPKKKTMQIIKEAETYDRGFYTGIMGYFDGKDLDSAVMIRFVEQEGGKMYFKSGGGITSQSDVENEYNEMKQKVYVPIY